MPSKLAHYSGIGADQQEKRKLGSGQTSESFLNELPSNSKSRNIRTKVFSGINILFQSVASVVVTHIIVILFGAYIIQEFEETLTFSLFIATLVFIRPLIRFGSSASLVICDDWSWSNPSQVQGAFVLLGAWLGAFIIPLDWDRPWQAWPLPCVLGGLIGEIASSSILILNGLSKPKKLV